MILVTLIIFMDIVFFFLFGKLIKKIKVDKVNGENNNVGESSRRKFHLSDCVVTDGRYDFRHSG